MSCTFGLPVLSWVMLRAVDFRVFGLSAFENLMLEHVNVQVVLVVW